MGIFGKLRGSKEPAKTDDEPVESKTGPVGTTMTQTVDEAEHLYKLGRDCDLGRNGTKNSAKNAFKYYSKASSKGHVCATARTGLCLVNGHGTGRNETRGRGILYDVKEDLRKEAEAGNADAQSMLGVCYHHGYGAIGKSLDEALTWYRRAADQGDVNAQYNLGYCLYYGIGTDMDYNEATALLTSAADQGLPEAQCLLGLCYDNGNGVHFSQSRAMELYKAAADQGDPRAMCYLGLCYEMKFGDERAAGKAVSLYREAADAGFGIGGFLFGRCYFSGTGVPHSVDTYRKWFKRSFEWIRDAAVEGDADAQYYLSEYYRYGFVPASKSESEAKKWCTRAAEQGQQEAIRTLNYQRRKTSTTVTVQSSEDALRRKAEGGDANAQYEMGMRHYGKGSLVDYWIAVKWFEMAANQGHAKAQFNLGCCYLKGDGVALSEMFAAIWFRKAAEQGHVDAQYNLGYCYAHGRGVRQDYNEAVKWLKKAENNGSKEARRVLDEIRIYI